MKKRSKRTQSSKKVKTVSETSAGAVVFYIENSVIKVLLMEKSRPEGELDIPKGHIEKGETAVAAAQREILEEIGLPLHIDTNFTEEVEYTFKHSDSQKGKNTAVNKHLIVFVAFLQRRETKQIVLNMEHTKHYLMPIDEAIAKVPFETQKLILRKAKAYITQHYLT